MSEHDPMITLNETIDAVALAVDEGDIARIDALLAPLQPAEVAGVLEGLPIEDRHQLIAHVPNVIDGEVLLHMGEAAAAELSEKMDITLLRDAAEEMDTTDVAELLDILPEDAIKELLGSMDDQRRARVEASLAYADDTVGRLMHTDAITVRIDVTLETVQRYLRRLDDVPLDTDTLIVVNREGKFQGALPVLSLLCNHSDMRVAEVINSNVRTLKPETSEAEVAKLFENHDLFSAPVVSDTGLFLGRVMVDDVVDIIREQADIAFMRRAGLDEEEDLFAPLFPSARRRAIWLSLNLATAFLASWVIGLFEATLQQIVALAVLMPIVASMGGIAGSQSLTLTIRGIALGQVADSNIRWLLRKELGIGLINGILWALVVAVIATLWFGHYQIGLVIGAALVVNLIAATVSGVAVPIILQRLHIDPALSGAVILTTITDVIGFMAFLGLATLFLI